MTRTVTVQTETGGYAVREVPMMVHDESVTHATEPVARAPSAEEVLDRNHAPLLWPFIDGLWVAP